MSEPAKTKKANRNNVLPVKLSDEEEHEIHEEAAFAGLTPTQLARSAILQYVRERKRKRERPSLRRAG